MTFDQIFPMALRLTRHRQDAEDLALEALFRCWRYPGTKPWTALRHAWRDMLRKRVRRPITVTDEDWYLHASPYDVHRQVEARIELFGISERLPVVDGRAMTSTERGRLYRARRKLCSP